MDVTRLGFWRIAERAPDRAALVLPEDEVVTYGDLRERANRLVHGLRACGVRGGETVTVILPNGPEFAEVLLATSQAGLYLTPVNHHLTAAEMTYIIDNAETSAVVVHERFAREAKEALAGCDVAAGRWFAIGEVDGFRAYYDLTEGQPSTVPPERATGTTMTYTSGTTGRPKGVRRPLPELDPDNYAAGYNVLQFFGIGPEGDQVHLCGSPLYHTAPLAYFMCSLNFGHKVVLRDRWTPEGFLADVERYRVTHTHMVPTQFHRLLALPEETKRRYDTSSLRLIAHAGAPCPPGVKREMIDWLGPIVYEYYGASEGVGGTFVSPAEALERPGTVGRPIRADTVIKILDDDGNELSPGEVGTVYSTLVGGAQSFQYFKDEAKSAEARRGDLFTVGDLGYLDVDGYLYLVSRRTDLILSGGVNIYPAEVEAALMEHPSVADVAVFGVPNEEWGEEVKAVVELVDGVRAGPETAEEIREFSCERLARFKVPRTVDFMDRLPRDPNGKLYKRRLRDLYW